MLHPPNGAAARDPIVRAQGRNVSESSASNHRNMWRFGSGACFVILLLAAFGRPLLGLANYAAHSSLHSHILLIPFVSGYLLYLRRDQLPKERVADPMADALESASKYASAEVANILFHLSGTPILRAGRVFQLPNITIEVAQECSGIRSSWVLLMTSVLAANLFLKTSWRRIVLLAFIIPLGILRNGFRILVIGLLCVNVGPQMIHSPIHTRGGPIFFVLSLIPLLLLLWWLRKGEIRARSVE